MEPNLIHRYISHIYSNYNNTVAIDSEPVLLSILEQFAWEKSLSAYAICSKLKSIDNEAFKKMAYKNVNKRIHTLLSLKLIQETGTNETANNKHNAKYYMLSEHGIFHLFLNRLDGILIRQLETIKSGALSTNTQSFFRNYYNSMLFESFLYPYFRKETLLAIGNFLLWDLFHYLADCCHRIKGQLEYHRLRGQSEYYNYDIPSFDTIFCWNKVPGKDSEKLSQFLKGLFKLQSVAHIKEDPDDSCLRKVETSSASIELKLDNDRKKVEIMSTATGKWERIEYDVSEMNSDILVGNQKPFEEYKDVLDNAKNQMEQIIYGFVYDLGLSVLDSQKTEEYSYYRKILSKDKKFINMLNDIFRKRHKGFERGYRMLKTYDR